MRHLSLRWGIPFNAKGGSGCGGSGYSDDVGYAVTTGSGGAAGAGFVIVARGIYITTGTVDLRGINGTNSTPGIPNVYAMGGGGGGGAGGSFIGLAERVASGLENIIIYMPRILVSGGQGGASSHPSKGYVRPGAPGGAGAIITQIIG